jgi:hypothetical protein
MGLQRTAWHLRAEFLRLPHLHLLAFALLQRVAASHNLHSEQKEEFLHFWCHCMWFFGLRPRAARGAALSSSL